MILRINRVEVDDVSDGQTPLCLRYQIDGIAGSNFTFKENGEVKACTTAAQKAFHDVWLTKSDAELEAGHPRLRDDKLCRPHSQTVANPDVLLEQALDGQILAEDSPGKVHLGKLSVPIHVVLGRITVNGLVDAPMHRQVALLVALEVERGHSQSAVSGCLEDGGAYCLSAPFNLAWKPNVQGHNSHANLTVTRTLKIPTLGTMLATLAAEPPNLLTRTKPSRAAKVETAHGRRRN